jgi:hypothetical protein
MDPGSAAHHAATAARLRCIRGTPVIVGKKPARQMGLTGRFHIIPTKLTNAMCDTNQRGASTITT